MRKRTMVKAIAIAFTSFYLGTVHVQAVDIKAKSSTLSAGIDHVCAIKGEKETLICWGRDSEGQTDAPGGTFLQVSAGYYFNCGLRSDHSIACWGQDTSGSTSPPGDTYPSGGQFIQVEAGGSHACALQADGNVRCWGANGSSQSVYLPGPFTQLALGDAHSCGLRTDGSVECWGNDSHGQASTPSDTFTSISAGYKTTCGIKSDGVAACWGYINNTYGYLTQTAVSLIGDSDGTGSQSTHLVEVCGIRADGSVNCPNMDSVPSGVFKHVVTGGHTKTICHANCGSILGYDTYHQEFYGFACGIRENNLVACWGVNHYNRATPPVGVPIKLPDGIECPSCNGDLGSGFTQINLDNAKAEGVAIGQQNCKNDPASCGISVGFTQAEVDQKISEAVAATQQSLKACLANNTDQNSLQTALDNAYQEGFNAATQAYSGSASSSDLVQLTGSGFYSPRDTVNVQLKEAIDVESFEQVDLWVAIELPDGTLLYMTYDPFNQFAMIPTPFKRSLQRSNNTHQIFAFNVPPGMGGDYLFYAFFVKENSDMTHLFRELKSNLATAKITLSNQ
ncbi:MAG: hypothetical protein DRR08_31015 [Candidatus Parabeggiatoa sp. nov. 2]|nr:MAG: hypothetical protein B6247_17030 [Beggiatoa sp. 4572_84]RKZ49396.1 MAG: hypothetical protein DRR08_31015 [Gammaproteobacteria bacterium]